jgi:hypothetical protein
LSNTNFIKSILYNLQNEYGNKATFIKIISEQTNSLTGQRTVTRDILQLKKVVNLPEDVAKKYWYDMAFLKANTNFTYGGEVDVKVRQVIIVKKDLKGREITLQDFLIIDRLRYHITKIYDLEHDLGYLVQLKATKGPDPYTVIEEFVQQYWPISQEVLNA